MEYDSMYSMHVLTSSFEKHQIKAAINNISNGQMFHFHLQWRASCLHVNKVLLREKVYSQKVD